MTQKTANQLSRASLAKLGVNKEMIDALAEDPVLKNCSSSRLKKIITDYIEACREFGAIDPQMSLHAAIANSPDVVQHALMDLKP